MELDNNSSKSMDSSSAGKGGILEVRPEGPGREIEVGWGEGVPEESEESLLRG